MPDIYEAAVRLLAAVDVICTDREHTVRIRDPWNAAEALEDLRQAVEEWTVGPVDVIYIMRDGIHYDAPEM